MLSIKMPRLYRDCLTPNCGRKTVSKGVCARCYVAARRRERIAKGLCSIEGCGRHSREGATLCEHHRDSQLAYRASPERETVLNHKKYIQRGLPSYVGMPFFPEWFDNASAGEKWIIENIGKRPKDGGRWELHIVRRELGFVPGNLQWVPREKHSQEEFVNKLLKKIQDLENEILRLQGSDC
jgi:hypothetical protein